MKNHPFLFVSTSASARAFARAALLCLPLMTATSVYAQVAGSTTIGVAAITQVAEGWSVKKSFLGKVVYNEDQKRVGKIEDVILAQDGTASYLIIGAGGFIGVGRHDVAIPVQQMTQQDGKFVLAGATKQAIKDMPKFVYAK